jgi:hypothetical protein
MNHKNVFIFAVLRYGTQVARLTDMASASGRGYEVSAAVGRVLDGALGLVRNVLCAQAATQRQARLLPGATPDTPEERLIADKLAGAERVDVDAVVDAVSTALYRQELDEGGSAAELSLLGSRVFVPDVLRALEGGDGRLWALSAVPPAA